MVLASACWYSVEAVGERPAGIPPVETKSMEKIQRVKVNEWVQPCAICTRHGNTCAMPGEPVFFEVKKTPAMQVLAPMRPGGDIPPQTFTETFISRLVPVGPKEGECPESFKALCGEAGGEPVCGEPGELFCTKPVTSSQCFLQPRDKQASPVPMGSSCPPLEDMCSPEEKFDVGPLKCICGDSGLKAGSECTRTLRLSPKVIGLGPDGTVDNCASSCTPPLHFASTRRRRGISGCLSQPPPKMCPQVMVRKMEIRKIDASDAPDASVLEETVGGQMCAVCSKAGSECILETDRVEFKVEVESRILAGGDAIELKPVLERLEVMADQGKESPDDAKEAIEQLKKSNFLVEEEWFRSSMRVVKEQSAQMVTDCKKGFTSEQKEVKERCQKAGGAFRRIGCTDLFCTTSIFADRCKVNGKVVIEGERCPDNTEQVLCAPGSTFTVGQVASCKCTNGIKAESDCKATEPKSQPPLRETADSVEPQLGACRASCQITITSVMEDGKVTTHAKLGKQLPQLRLSEESTPGKHQESVKSVQENFNFCPVMMRPIAPDKGGQGSLPPIVPMPEEKIAVPKGDEAVATRLSAMNVLLSKLVAHHEEHEALQQDLLKKLAEHEDHEKEHSEMHQQLLDKLAAHETEHEEHEKLHDSMQKQLLNKLAIHTTEHEAHEKEHAAIMTKLQASVEESTKYAKLAAKYAKAAVPASARRRRRRRSAVTQ